MHNSLLEKLLFGFPESGDNMEYVTLETMNGTTETFLVPKPCEFPRANELMEYAIVQHKCQYNGPLPITRILPNVLVRRHLGSSIVRGSFIHDNKEIWINGKYTYGEQASSWVHEATHFLQLVIDLGGDPARMCDSVAGIIEREVQAYIVQRQWLLDTGTKDPHDSLVSMSEDEIRQRVVECYSERGEELVASRSRKVSRHAG